MLVWSLKQVKDLILKFSMSESFFSKKQFLNLYVTSSGCVDEVVDNRTNYQGYEYNACAFSFIY